jgi:hypothetical protein
MSGLQQSLTLQTSPQLDVPVIGYKSKIPAPKVRIFGMSWGKYARWALE